MGCNSDVRTPVSAGALNIVKNKKLMKRARRTALIITTTAYRTVSYSALGVLSDNMPIHIKASMRKEIYDKTRNPKRVTGVKHGVDNPNNLMLEINIIINNNIINK